MKLPSLAMLAALLLIGCGPQQEPVAKTGGEKQLTTGPQPAPPDSPPTKTQKQAPADPTADDAPGIAVGEPAPDFKLMDQDGQEQSLKQLIAEQNVALVFYRSADW